MNLSKQELERYARHIVMPEIGGAGQQKLKQARVLLVGVGGLGCPILQYLTAAGIGNLRFVDGDVVSLANLQRQILFGQADIGKPKVQVAKKALAKLNENCNLEPFNKRFDENSADELLQGCDLALDACDNFATRHILADFCEKMKIPLISGALGRFDGTITTLKPYLKPYLNPYANKKFPKYSDIFPISENNNLPTCSEIGIIGTLCGFVGSIQANEAIKELLNIGDGLVGKLLIIDGFSLRFQIIRYFGKKNEKNEVYPLKNF